jgi:hypothetical protein
MIDLPTQSGEEPIKKGQQTIYSASPEQEKAVPAGVEGYVAETP